MQALSIFLRGVKHDKGTDPLNRIVCLVNFPGETVNKSEKIKCTMQN